MASQNTVWVIINCQPVVNAMRERLDNGAFSEINTLLSYLKSFEERLSSMVQKAGGHVYVMLYERIVLEIPITLAEQIPDMVKELKDKLGPDVSCGIGLDYEEANRACLISAGTGRIEMYGEDTQKNDDYAEPAFEIPPNLFNPQMQNTVNNPIPDRRTGPKTPVLRPGLEEELQIDAQYLQAIGQTLGVGAAAEAQQQAAKQQQAQQGGEGKEGPRDLLEALNGGPVDGHHPEEEEKEGSKEPEIDSKEGGSEEKAEDGGDDAKLASLLLNIRDRIPELIALQEKNPEAFKQSLVMIQKLIGLARSRKKSSAKKSEIDSINGKLDELTKKIAMRYPVGTRKGRKVKVIIDGKAVWRSMSAGRVIDSKGQPISVKSHNAAATSGSQEEQK